MIRVNVPWGCSQQVYTSLIEKERFSYANVRKATYRGIEEKNKYFKSDYQHYSFQILRDWRNIPVLVL